MHYAIEGLMPATGATVWFGSGSTGKTQLLLWLAAHIAARGEIAPTHWLGQDINVRGQILVLTAEDLREHVFARVGSIARVLVAQSGGTDDTVQAICDRIHVMAFLSMSEEEFSEPNPCLFQQGPGGQWSPSTTLQAVESFLQDWNSNASEDDRIVGVILDSAVSMSGFEMANSEATTNFLFYINRMSRRQNMFWAIIGHTPKDAGRKLDDPAIERLRGSAMWSTTPRTVIEVRVAGPSDNTEEAEAAYPGLAVRDIVYVSVAKANSQNADLRPRALKREDDGTFTDLTKEFPELFSRAQRGIPAGLEKHVSPMPSAIDAAWNAVVGLIENITEGGKPESRFTRTDLAREYERQLGSVPILNEISGGAAGTKSRKEYTLSWYLFQLRDVGALRTKGHEIVVVDLTRARSNGSKPEPALTDVPTESCVVQIDSLAA